MVQELNHFDQLELSSLDWFELNSVLVGGDDSAPDSRFYKGSIVYVPVSGAFLVLSNFEPTHELVLISGYI